MSADSASPLSAGIPSAGKVAAIVARIEHVGDQCNPIVVREVRQALKSRQFVVTFLLLLLVAWAGSLFGVSYQGEAIDYGAPAGLFFAGFLLVLSLTSLVIVPFSAYRSIVEERAETTLELVQITALTPAQIVRGKTQSAMVQVLVYYCAIAPFIAFSALLPGFDVVHVIFALVMLAITSLCFSMIALAIGAQARQKTSQAFSSLAVIGLASAGLAGFYAFMTRATSELRFDHSETWWGLGFFLFIAVSTGYLCEQSAVAQLTFESDNRSTRIRLAATAQWLVCGIGLLAYLIVQRPPMFPPDTLEAILTLFVLYITIAGVFFCCEPDSLSRRVSRGLPLSSVLRIIYAPFLPGGARGFLYSLLSLLVAALLTALLHARVTPGAGQGNPAQFAVVLLSYSIIYLATATFVARSLRRWTSNVVAFHILAFLGLANILLIVGAEVIHFLVRQTVTTPQFFDAVNPLLTLRMITAEAQGFWELGLYVAICAAAAFIINIPALRRGVTDVVENPVRAELERRRHEAQLTATAAPTDLPSTEIATANATPVPSAESA
jgi:hypothetical protein